MKKVIIGIHGLGNKPPKFILQKWWRAAMLEGLKTHNITKELPHIEMVYWADILYENPHNNWENDNENPLYLKEPYVKAPKLIKSESHSFRQKVTYLISEQLNNIFLNNDKTLNYSFLTDIILKKYFKDLDAYYQEELTDKNDVTHKTRDLIRNRISEAINKYKDYEVLIIAHSMGSIIAFDVLNYLIPEKNINTLITIGSPLGLPVVISKIASEQKKNGKSIMATPPGITKAWYNMADVTDNVALNYKLSDDFLPNKIGIAPIDFLVQNNYEINGEKNPHKSYGYLRTPEFSNVLSEFIGEKQLSLDQKILNITKRVFVKMKEQLQLVWAKIVLIKNKIIQNIHKN